MILFSKSVIDGLHLIVQHLTRKLGHFLFTWKTQRLIFLSTIYGMAVDNKKLDTEHAEKLAKVLNITNDSRTLELPFTFKSVVWFHTTKDGIVTEKRKLSIKDLGRKDISEKECECIIAHIVQNAPCLLIYAKPSQMAYDVKRLAGFLRAMP